MAKVTLTLTDTDDGGVLLTLESDPAVTEETDLEDLTEAQTIGGMATQYIRAITTEDAGDPNRATA